MGGNKMDNTQKFDDKAEFYENSRPGYPEKAVNDIIKRCNLDSESVIADIGSGTGKLSRCFFSIVKKIYCIEPNNSMRSAAEKHFYKYKSFVSVNGAAENTTIKDHCADLITAAQSFHWFDTEKFKAECVRIGKPNAAAALIWNSRDPESDITRENAELFKRFCPDFTGFSGGAAFDKSKIEEFFTKGYEKLEYDNPLKYSEHSFIERALSASYSLKPNDKNFKEYINSLRDLFFKYSSDGIVTVPNITNVYIGEI